MDRNTFRYSLKMTTDPILLINAVDNHHDGSRVVEVWIIDNADRNSRHLVDTIVMEYDETPSTSRVLQKVKEYNQWFNEATGRPQIGFDI